MVKTGNVSLNVQSDVSLKYRITSESKQGSQRPANSLGRYLIRNGNTILFQMRAPKNAIHPNGYIVRISLGALSLREAREIADELASLTRNEVFHSLRGGYISESAEQQIDRRERKLQVGHQLGDDEHDQYGFKALTDKQARRIALLSFASDIDLSMYRGLDFEKMSRKKRRKLAV